LYRKEYEEKNVRQQQMQEDNQCKDSLVASTAPTETTRNPNWRPEKWLKKAQVAIKLQGLPKRSTRDIILQRPKEIKLLQKKQE
jgi:hypothetical protein